MLGRLMHGGTIDQQAHRGQLIPVLLLLLNKLEEVPQESSVKSLDHPIGLRVQRGRSCLVDAQQLEETLEHPGLEMASLVGVQLQGNSIAGDHLLQQSGGHGLGPLVADCRNLGPLREVVHHDYQVAIPPWSLGQRAEDVDGNSLKGCSYIKRPQLGAPPDTCPSPRVADITPPAVVFPVPLAANPVEPLSKLSQGLVDSKVASSPAVVAVLDHLALQGGGSPTWGHAT